MTLIFKKGDPSKLTKLRPTQLVCTDSKTLTCILNQRIMDMADQTIKPQQLGFNAWQVYRSKWFNGSNDFRKCCCILLLVRAPLP
jgi:hypothetical protein